MNALSYWKLAKNPFAPDSTLYFVAGSVEEAVARTEFLVKSRRSLGLLTGLEGVGKTALLQQSCRRPIRVEGFRRVHSLFGSARGMTGQDLLASFVSALQDGRKNQSVRSAGVPSPSTWTTLSDILIATRAMESHLVWFIDDIGESSGVTEAIRRLMDLDGPLTILLACSTAQTSALPPPFINLCELRIDLPAWDLGLTADYFDFAIEQVCGNPSIFEAQAITRIHELSDGLPARMTRLADLALFAGASRRSPRVSSEIIDEVREELAMFEAKGSRELLSPGGI